MSAIRKSEPRHHGAPPKRHKNEPPPRHPREPQESGAAYDPMLEKAAIEGAAEESPPPQPVGFESGGDGAHNAAVEPQGPRGRE